MVQEDVTNKERVRKLPNIFFSSAILNRLCYFRKVTVAAFSSLKLFLKKGSLLLMNIALPEMLHNITSNGSSELSVLDRTKWQVQQQEMSYFNGQNDQLMNSFHQTAEAQQFHGLINVNDQSLNELVTRAIKPDPCMENSWGDFGTTGTNGFDYVPVGVGHGGMSHPSEMNYAISRTTSCPPTMADNVVKPKDTRLSSNRGRESFKKRKAGKNQHLKVCSTQTQTVSLSCISVWLRHK